LLGDFDELRPAVAEFDDRRARVAEFQHLRLRRAQHGFGQGGGTGTEIERTRHRLAPELR
jgi:hypothetical protein